MIDGAKRLGVEDILLHLLEKNESRELDQGNLLILLSLVNLMGIVTTIQSRLGVGNETNAKNRALKTASSHRDMSEKTPGAPFDPMLLQSMLGGSGASQLTSMLSKMMTSAAGSPERPDTQTSSREETMEKAAE